MRDHVELPEGYKEVFRVDLLHNKRMLIIVNVINTVIALVMFIGGIIIEPRMFGGRFDTLLICCVGMWIYIVLHELVHGVFMKKYSGIKPTYGFKVIYAYAGSKAYFCKSHYIIIAMAPVVIWGIVLGIMTPLVPRVWFWTVYFIQLLNVSGAAGDFYVTYLMWKMPDDILVQDSGTDMRIYSKENIKL